MSGEPSAGAPDTTALDVAEDGTWRPPPAPRDPEAAPVPSASPPRAVPAGAVVAALDAVPPPEPTGEERVDAVLGRLTELAGLPVTDHVEIFEEVHRGLQEALTSVDQQTPVPRPPGPGIVPPRPGHGQRGGR